MSILEKKYQVFISSTYEDLIVERQEVVTAVLNAGHIPAGMELFKAGPTQEEVIREWIEESDIYVLILGPRYGSLNSEGISYTQWEYNLAKELDKPMFSIVLTDDYITEMVSDGKIKPIRLETSNDKYIRFKEQVLNSLVVQVNHIAEIRSGVSDSIRDIEKHHSEKLNGWIKGEYYQELEELRRKNKEISEQLVSSQAKVIDMQEELRDVKDEFIGDLSFESVFKGLNDALLSDEALSENNEEVKRETAQISGGKRREDISEQSYQLIKEFYNKKKQIKSILDWLTCYENKILEGDLEIKRRKRYRTILEKEVMAQLEKFGLINYEDVVLSDSSKNSTKCTVVFTSEGKKFMHLLNRNKES
ncbi:DUF4062 domain-containing protein [Enterococcus hirae]|nr:DUF4062 domain-containing protein [Enterococcus hirae]